MKRVKVPELEELKKNGKPKCRPWTEDEEAILVTYRDEVRLADIAAFLGRSLPSVESKSRRLARQR